jgi:hypothetical protein
MTTTSSTPRGTKRRAGEVCAPAVHPPQRVYTDRVFLPLKIDDHSAAQPKKIAPGKEADEQPPRLCAIYLRDVISLLDPGTVHALGQVSAHSNSTISRVGATDRLPRHPLECITIATFPVSPQASSPFTLFTSTITSRL